MTQIIKCQLCGEPMPEGETMFNFHGYSGPCPKPPLAVIETMKPHAEYFSAAKPFDATKDGCLLDAMEQALSLCAKNELGLMFTIGVVRRDDGWRIEVFAPGEEGHGEGRTVREALRNLFNESEIESDVR